MGLDSVSQCRVQSSSCFDTHVCLEFNKSVFHVEDLTIALLSTPLTFYFR